MQGIAFDTPFDRDFMPVPPAAPIGDDAADHAAIRAVLDRLARGMERRDQALIDSVFWPEAGHQAGQAGLAAMIRALPLLQGARRSTQMPGDLRITLTTAGGAAAGEADGTATVESRVVASHLLDVASDQREIVIGGRYIDRLERRHGDWRIADRRFLPDWKRVADAGW
ncbi:MAG: hypothetical protein RLY86_2314 [Pseudomonadota bacterium]|jgi:hypothetical protein